MEREDNVVDMEVIITALITGTLSFISSATLINYRLKKLEDKVDEHNGYAQKYAETHEDIALIKQDIGYIKEKIKS